MDEKLYEDLVRMIDALTIDEVIDNANDWRLTYDRERLVYALAFNDGLLKMAKGLKEKIKELLPQKFEEAADDQS